jgi:hypothetical protein
VDKSSTIKLVFMTDEGAEYLEAPLKQLKLLRPAYLMRMN